MEGVKEERFLPEADIRDAIDKILTASMVTQGRVDVASMSHSDIDYAIHMLRNYKVVKFGWPTDTAEVA